MRALLLGLFLVAVSSINVFAQKTPAQLISEINSQLASGTNITAATLRGVLTDMVNSGSQVVNATAYGVSATSTNNATALQNAINAAVAANSALYIPAASQCYKYTAPLTIGGNLLIIGDYVAENWSGGINAPLGSPALVGSVLCPTSNGSDAIDISATSLNVGFAHIGILFQTPLNGTGDGIHYIPGTGDQGLSGSVWYDVKIFGHDGNHYAVNLTNFIYDTFVSVDTYGGGGFKLHGATPGNYGNSLFLFPLAQVLCGGSAHGITLTSDSALYLNLLVFVRPQVNTNNVAGLTSSCTVPTSAQYIFTQDANTEHVKIVGGDLETNVSSPIQIQSGGNENDYDFNSLFTTAASINAPDWGTTGILQSPNSYTINNTTSTGTIAIEAMYAYPGTHMSATSATTATILTNLYVGQALTGTNVTAPTQDSIYATGQIQTNSTFSGNGLFIGGNSQINANGGSHTTELGDGTTSGQVTIGGSSNTTQLGSATLNVPNAAGGTATKFVCSDSSGNWFAQSAAC